MFCNKAQCVRENVNVVFRIGWHSLLTNRVLCSHISQARIIHHLRDAGTAPNVMGLNHATLAPVAVAVNNIPFIKTRRDK